MTTRPGLDACEQLYARYTHAYDEGRADDVADLFTVDGEFVRPGADPVRGRTDLAAIPRTIMRTAGGSTWQNAGRGPSPAPSRPS